uniref:BTB domain-containing protein n=1 Tax=Timema bartmani TaxID=61472 RepID=A0A7R9EUX7_9NEOP|nr:unnamed protein product [Timema bartmani]
MEEEQDKSLATKMRDFLNSGLGSDVEVKVGKDSDFKTFRAHRSILAFSSPLFLAKFYENKEVDCNPVNVIEEQDIDPETFTTILECPVPHHMVFCRTLESLTQVVSSGWQELINNPDLLDITPSVLDLILDENDLQITSELELLQFIVNWSNEECKRKELAATAKNKRKLLESTLCKIRFRALSPDSFVSFVELKELLSCEEYRNILMNIVKPTLGTFPSSFCNMERRRGQITVCCFRCRQSYTPDTAKTTNESLNPSTSASNKNVFTRDAPPPTAFSFGSVASTQFGYSDHTKRKNTKISVGSFGGSSGYTPQQERGGFFSQSVQANGFAASVQNQTKLKQGNLPVSIFGNQGDQELNQEESISVFPTLTQALVELSTNSPVNETSDSKREARRPINVACSLRMPGRVDEYDVPALDGCRCQRTVLEGSRKIQLYELLTSLFCLLCCDHVTGEAHLHGFRLAHNSGQPLSAASARNCTDSYLWLTKAGLIPCIYYVAHHGQLTSSTQLYNITRIQYH